MVYEYKSQDSSYVRLLLIQLKHTHECLLWYLYIAHLTHPLLPSFCFSSSFFLREISPPYTWQAHPWPGRGGDKGGREPLAQRRAWQNSKCHAPMAKMAVSGSDSVSDTGSASDSEPDIVLPDGELTALTRPPAPDEPDFCPPDEGEVRDYFIRKSGTEAQADRFRASMNPTAGGWARTPCGTGRQRLRSGWPATGSGRLPPRRTSRKQGRSTADPPA